MLWIWIALVPVVLVALVFAVGSLLPQRYRAQGSVDAAGSAEEVWRRLLDYHAHPMAARMAKGVEPLPDENGLPVWIEDLGPSKVRVRTVESAAQRRLVREMTDTVAPVTARAVIEVEARDGGCRIRMSNQTVVGSGTWHGPVFRVMITLFGGVRRGIAAYLAQIAGGAGVRVRWE